MVISSFLWGGDQPAPNHGKFEPRATVWWSQYEKRLRVSDAARTELTAASCDIVSLLPDPLLWGDAPRPFRGLVVGAVQSGKTASMLGVSAVALDQGYKIIVVLAGGRDDLRMQTARRFNTQLLWQSDPIPGCPGTLTIPKSERPLGGFALPYFSDAHQYGLLRIKLSAALERGEPAVLVIKKHPASLSDVRSELLQAYERFGVANVPTLIIDDECDEASVDQSEQTIPAAIANLWAGKEPFNTVYLGYTATAAANLLQRSDNDLFPSDFAYLLRYPASESDQLRFVEVVPDSWYSGGDTFYEDVTDPAPPHESILIEPIVTDQHLAMPPAENESLLAAVRAFLVSGAYRLALQQGYDFDDVAHVPSPHSMIVQASTAVADHDAWANGIVEAFSGSKDGNVYKLASARMTAELSSTPELWESWYRSFRVSRERINQRRPRNYPQPQPTWDQVRSELENAIKATKLKVLNGEPNSSSLDFDQRITEDGTPLPPDDVFTIIVGGAKLSRGLTIEGLCISYFTRWNPNPTEDTVLQLCRWYGYRGSHLEFCRVFTTEHAALNLAKMHDNDRQLRYQLADLMTQHKSPRDAALVLAANPCALPTAKLGEGIIRDIAFSPYENVFRDVECDDLAKANENTALAIVKQILERQPVYAKNDAGAIRGVYSLDWSAAEVASLLDSLEYSAHNPDIEANPAKHFYRPTDASRPIAVARRFSDDPYQVSAYLRQWASTVGTQGVNALPKFNVGVVFGEMDNGTAPFTHPLMNRHIDEECRITSSWTGKSGGWRGDAFFDSPAPEFVVPGSSIRKSGASGLLLLHVVHKNARGRKGLGMERQFHTPTFGIVIPSGGPSFRRVIVDRRSK